MSKLDKFDVFLSDCELEVRFPDAKINDPDYWAPDTFKVIFAGDILPGCCGVLTAYEPDFAYHKHAGVDIYSSEFMDIMQAAIVKGLKDCSSDRGGGVGKIIMADITGGWIDRFCTHNNWYCSPFRSINPKTGNSICVYEFALEPEKKVV